MIPAGTRSRLLGELPPAALQPFHRVVTFPPTNLPVPPVGNVGPVRPFRVNLMSQDPTATVPSTTTPVSTPQTMGLIILWVSQSWLVRGQDPLDPNVYTRMQSAQGACGRFSMALSVDGRNVGQIDETIYDYYAVPAAGYHRFPGWTDLDRNLLFWGAEVSPAIYVPGNSKFEALFYQSPNAPWLHKPDVVSIEVNGYAVPAHTLAKILSA